MVVISLKLHSLVNLAFLICNIWPGFTTPLAIYITVGFIINMLGELTTIPFRWFRPVHVEAWASIGFAVVLSIIMNTVKLLNHGTETVIIEKQTENKNFMHKIRRGFTKIFKGNRIKTLLTPSKGWISNWVLLVWTLIINLFVASDFILIHYFTTFPVHWEFWVVLLGVTLVETIGVFVITFIIGFLKVNNFKNRSDGIWIPELIAFSLQFLFFKCGLAISYIAFHTNPQFATHRVSSERISLLIGIGAFVALDVILFTVKFIVKYIIPKKNTFLGRLIHAPEVREQGVKYRKLGGEVTEMDTSYVVQDGKDIQNIIVYAD